MNGEGPLGVDKLFVYGILKRGFGCDLEQMGQRFMGEAQMHGAKLYSLGGGVGLRTTIDLDDVAHGELFHIVDPRKWAWLDGLESNGTNYTRSIQTITRPNPENGEADVFDAWVYVHTYYPGQYYGKQIKALKGGIYKGEYPPQVEA